MFWQYFLYIMYVYMNKINIFSLWLKVFELQLSLVKKSYQIEYRAGIFYFSMLDTEQIV